MADTKALRDKLEEFKRIKASEYDFRPIEKWMINELGVQPLPLKGGSHVFYEHRLLKKYAPFDGHFQVALKKGKTIYRRNFLEYTYKTLKKIIDCMELEVQGER